jgi:hypothetical protein
MPPSPLSIIINDDIQGISKTLKELSPLWGEMGNGENGKWGNENEKKGK